MKDKKDHKQDRLDNLFSALPDPQSFGRKFKKYKRKPPKAVLTE